MKKSLILCLAVLALLAAGTLGALGTASVEPIDETVGIAGLPTTVLDQVTTQFAFCVRPDVSCPDVYDPVTCSNGVTYSNGCYAWLACATDCTSGGASS